MFLKSIFREKEREVSTAHHPRVCVCVSWYGFREEVPSSTTTGLPSPVASLSRIPSP